MGSGSTNDVLKEGWLFKKRRKKLQGFASRYFRLHSSGLLSYSIHPSISPRDQILLSSAVVSSFSTTPCDVHIDSDYSTFHIKFKSVIEAQQWMPLFRKFIQGTISNPTEEPARPEDIVQIMERSIHELNRSLTALKQEDFNLKSPNFFKFKRDKDDPAHLANVLKNKDGRLNKFFKTYDTAHSTSGAPSNKDTRGHAFSRLDRISKAVEIITTQYQLLASSMNNIQQSASVQRQPSHGTETMLRRGMVRPRSSSIRSAMPGSPSNESIWHDAQDFIVGGEGGEELVLESDRSDDTASFDELISRSPSPTKGTDDESHEFSSTPDVDNQGSLTPQIVFERRIILPSPICVDEGSLFTAFKKNIGKDLSNVSLPVSFNEPISLLQRLCEDTEYSNLLEFAVASDDPVQRICYVAAFAVSGYAGTKLRSGRKSFTPMLSETFEDTRSNFIAEKVSHSPLIMACHAHGEGWEYWSTSAGKTRFWGKSLEIIQTGTSNLRIGTELFQWQRPSTFVRNLVMGTKYLEHCGQITITKSTSGLSCTLDFKETGYWGTSPNVVSGKVMEDPQNILAKLEGRWDEQLSQILDETHLKVLWKAHPFPRHAPDYYGLSTFATTLNEITPDIRSKLPPSDSRLRPDIRAMEEGNIDLADREKSRLEEQQRLWRAREDHRIKPRWFARAPGSDNYIYKGGYWEERAKGWTSNQPWW